MCTYITYIDEVQSQEHSRIWLKWWGGARTYVVIPVKIFINEEMCPSHRIDVLSDALHYYGRKSAGNMSMSTPSNVLPYSTSTSMLTQVNSWQKDFVTPRKCKRKQQRSWKTWYRSPQVLTCYIMTASTILLLQTYVVPFSSFQEDIKVWDQEEKANLRRQTINPFLDVAGYIRHGHMRVFKKIQKILFWT